MMTDKSVTACHPYYILFAIMQAVYDPNVKSFLLYSSHVFALASALFNRFHLTFQCGWGWNLEFSLSTWSV